MHVLLSLLVVPAFADSHSFTDDEGTKHTWTKAKPTVLVNARFALGLMHFGLGADQLHSTFGQYSTSGSNYDHGLVDDEGKRKGYADGNMADHGKHNEAAFDLDQFPAHPNEVEMKILKGALDLSPGCSGVNYWCTELDWKKFESGGWPDVIIHKTFDDYAMGKADGEFLGNATERNIPIIMISWSHPPANDGDTATPRSFPEIVHRVEELAIALGAESEDIAAAVKKEKGLFCKAADEFKQVAKGASERGVRALAGYFPYNGPNDGINEDGESIYGFLYGPPTDQTLLMMEELGMQILHVTGSAPEYNTHMFPDNLTSLAVGRPVYPVDFFLPDIRVWLDVSSDKFAQKWPHPAITAGQFAPYPSGGRVHSYQHGARMLARVGAALKVAEKVDPTGTTCTEVEVISAEVHRTTGLGVADYACYNPVTYSWCEGYEDWIPKDKDDSDDDDANDASSAAFAAVGLMLVLSA
jgi:hypothetical protein